MYILPVLGFAFWYDLSSPIRGGKTPGFGEKIDIRADKQRSPQRLIRLPVND
jgi:hypothetical protein